MRIAIGSKLAVALGVPLVAVGVLAGIEVAQASADASEVRRQADIATAALGPRGLADALQVEASMAAAYVGGVEDAVDLPVPDNATAREQTDAARRHFRAVMARSGDDVRATYGPALEALDALDAQRARVDGVEGPRGLGQTADLANEVYADYSELNSGLLDATIRISGVVRDRELRHGAALVSREARAEALRTDVVRSLVLGALSEGGLDDAQDLSWASRTVGNFEAELAAIERSAVGEYRPSAERLLADEGIVQLRALADESLDSGNVDIPSLLEVAVDGEGEGFDRFQGEVTDILVARADELRGAASRRQWWFAGASIVALAATSALTWLVARSITRPLRTLTNAARDIATRRLPEAARGILDTPLGVDVQVPSTAPVEVNSRDEVADVADALGTVHTTALELAVEQVVLRRNVADAFINMGRRNQGLLSRQLEFITELESSETNPDTLADLFLLDHMATRMRRNAESLLVLAGLETPRTWAAPVPLDQILRSALGEIGDYRRVGWEWLEAVTVSGSAAADLSHLLAELLENAVAASPAGQVVEVRGHSRPGGYSLAIIDTGIGMSDAAREQANRRLRGEESYTVAPSSYLGHYVAGQLAARHGIRLALDNSRGRGLTAYIELPDRVLVRHTEHERPPWAIDRPRLPSPT